MSALMEITVQGSADAEIPEQNGIAAPSEPSSSVTEEKVLVSGEFEKLISSIFYIDIWPLLLGLSSVPIYTDFADGFGSAFSQSRSA